jgi:aspartate/methionine/tyrosine aminotransferase
MMDRRGEPEMRFETIEYLEWAKTHPKSEVELTRSSVEDFPLDELGIDPRDFELNVARGYGYKPLLECLAEIYHIGPDRVTAALGASQGLFLVCAALLQPGDEVLVEDPAYEPLRAVPAALGARVTRIRRRFEDGYRIRLDDFRAALTSRTRLVVITNLHNPSGAALDSGEIARLAEAAASAGADLLVDEIYLDFAGVRPGAETAARLGGNVIVISSLTKVYGMGGLRCGWVLARPELIRRVDRTADYIHGEGVHLAEQISLLALERMGVVRERFRERLKLNLDLVDGFVAETPGLTWVKPAGGVVGFPRLEAGIGGDRLAEELYRNYATGVVPGRFFERPSHFRIGFGVESRILQQGLRRIGQALAGLRG